MDTSRSCVFLLNSPPILFFASWEKSGTNFAHFAARCWFLWSGHSEQPLHRHTLHAISCAGAGDEERTQNMDKTYTCIYFVHLVGDMYGGKSAFHACLSGMDKWNRSTASPFHFLKGLYHSLLQY